MRARLIASLTLSTAIGASANACHAFLEFGDADPGVAGDGGGSDVATTQDGTTEDGSTALDATPATPSPLCDGGPNNFCDDFEGTGDVWARWSNKLVIRGEVARATVSGLNSFLEARSLEFGIAQEHRAALIHSFPLRPPNGAAKIVVVRAKVRCPSNALATHVLGIELRASPGNPPITAYALCTYEAQNTSTFALLVRNQVTGDQDIATVNATAPHGAWTPLTLAIEVAGKWDGGAPPGTARLSVDQQGSLREEALALRAADSVTTSDDLAIEVQVGLQYTSGVDEQELVGVDDVVIERQ